MQIKRPTNLTLAIALAATTAGGFVGGALWNSAAPHVAAAQDPADPQTQQRAWLGLSLAPLTAELAARLNIQQQDGLVVLNVAPGGPAAQAGVQRLDVVKTINGQAVTDAAALRTLMQGLKAGDVVQLSLSRGGATQTVSLTAAEAPAPQGRGSHRGGPGFGFGLPAIPELQNIPADQRFDHLLGGSFSFRDQNGATITVRMVPGTVVSATDTQVVVTPNGSTTSTTYTITADTRPHGVGSHLAAGDKVVVTVREGSSDALSVHPASPKAKPQAGTGPHGFRGHGPAAPGQGPAAGQTTQAAPFGGFGNRVA